MWTRRYAINNDNDACFAWNACHVSWCDDVIRSSLVPLLITSLRLLIREQVDGIVPCIETLPSRYEHKGNQDIT
jgi:hypothetical protein